MNWLKKHNQIIKLYFFLFLTLFCLTACRMKAEQRSLTARLELIDSLIGQNQKNQAVKELKKLEKKALDSWSYLGLYRRYILLSQDESAEKLIKNALKRHPANSEILAVYSKFLIGKKRLNDAEKYAEKLKNTKYGSIYSEIFLKKSLLEELPADKFNFYMQEPFYQIFYDAWNGSKNSLWLKNCAVSLLYKGKVRDAAGLNPAYYSDADDAYFWAQVLYDNGDYYNAIASLELSRQYLKDYENSGLYKTGQIAQIALEADSYMALSDYEGAESIRRQLIPHLSEVARKEGDDALIPVIMVNSAIWSQSQKDDDSTADLLFTIVNEYPDFVPALILYADFAWESSLEREEDDEIKALRRAGISSLSMEKYDRRRKIPLSDALYRIDLCLAKGQEPYLEMEKLDLQYRTDKSISDREKTRNLWELLENNYVEGQKYRELLVQYALNFLLRSGQEDDAWNLFHKYISARYSFNEKNDFFVQAAEKIKEINLPMAEFAGYFAFKNKKFAEGQRIYEFCVYESGEIISDGQISTRVGTGTCMNLADVYFTSGDAEKAMNLYGKAAGREVNKKLRSEIFLRLANIYVSMGDERNALRSADYAYSIDNENERAFLLRTKLRLSQ